MDNLLTTEQVAEILGVTTRTLERWRSVEHKGPPVTSLEGSVIRYKESELDEYINRNTKTEGKF